MADKDILFVVKPRTSIDEALPQVRKYLDQNDNVKSLGIYSSYGHPEPMALVNGSIITVFNPSMDSVAYLGTGDEEDLDNVIAYEILEKLDR